MVTQITKFEACDKYLDQLQSEADGLSYVDKTLKRIKVYDPLQKRQVNLSYVDLIGELQRRTERAVGRAIEYVHQLKTGKGEEQYIVV